MHPQAQCTELLPPEAAANAANYILYQKLWLSFMVLELKSPAEVWAGGEMNTGGEINRRWGARACDRQHARPGLHLFLGERQKAEGFCEGFFHACSLGCKNTSFHSDSHVARHLPQLRRHVTENSLRIQIPVRPRNLGTAAAGFQGSTPTLHSLALRQSLIYLIHYLVVPSKLVVCFVLPRGPPAWAVVRRRHLPW